MATKTTRPAAKPNLFARAAEGSPKDTKRKKKGTALVLPRDLNDEGELQGESKVLNESITQAIEAKAAMDAAKGRLTTAMGNLKPHAEEAWCAKYAELGVQPETPVVVQNHKGEQATFVVQDKCAQNAVDDDQIELLNVLLGEDVAAGLIEKREVYSFDSDTMKQKAGGRAKKDETVQDVVFELVSKAILGSPKLSEEQKGTLINQESKTHLRRNTLVRLAELCGADVGKIAAFLQAADTAFVRYLKV